MWTLLGVERIHSAYTEYAVSSWQLTLPNCKHSRTTLQYTQVHYSALRLVFTRFFTLQEFNVINLSSTFQQRANKYYKFENVL